MVHEMFRSIQGESTFAGQPCSFIRLSGCPLRCVWCDTAYAYSGGQKLSLPQIVEHVDQLGRDLVEVTGGEPLAQADCPQLLSDLCDRCSTVLLETSGAIDVSLVDPRVVKIIDIKCPGSGQDHTNRWENFKHLGSRDELKCVIAHRSDYEWMLRVMDEFGLNPRQRPIHFTPVFGRMDPRQLAEWIMQDRLAVRLQLQIHKYIWDPHTKGV